MLGYFPVLFEIIVWFYATYILSAFEILFKFWDLRPFSHNLPSSVFQGTSIQNLLLDTGYAYPLFFPSSIKTFSALSTSLITQQTKIHCNFPSTYQDSLVVWKQIRSQNITAELNRTYTFTFFTKNLFYIMKKFVTLW